jgi:hypothetical protein
MGIGTDFEILEVEKLKISNKGMGIEIYNDGSNIYKGRNWNGAYAPTGSRRGLEHRDAGPTILAPASSSGWLKIHMISANTSTYGVTGATYYIPVFSNLDTKLSK